MRRKVAEWLARQTALWLVAVCVEELPERCRALDHPGQDGVANIVDCLQAAWRGTAPLEASRRRRPVKQRHMPRVGAAAALIVDEAIIDRAPRRDQPADR